MDNSKSEIRIPDVPRPAPPVIEGNLALLVRLIQEKRVEVTVDPDLPEEIDISFLYPRNGGQVSAVSLGLECVRSADSLRVRYDFARDGWSVEQLVTEPDARLTERWRDSGFFPAWQYDTRTEEQIRSWERGPTSADIGIRIPDDQLRLGAYISFTPPVRCPVCGYSIHAAAAGVPGSPGVVQIRIGVDAEHGAGGEQDYQDYHVACLQCHRNMLHAMEERLAWAAAGLRFSLGVTRLQDGFYASPAYIEKRRQRDETVRWVVFDHGLFLTKQGTWEEEPSGDFEDPDVAAFRDRTRFDTKEQAFQMFEATGVYVFTPPVEGVADDSGSI